MCVCVCVCVCVRERERERALEFTLLDSRLIYSTFLIGHKLSAGPKAQKNRDLYFILNSGPTQSDSSLLYYYIFFSFHQIFFFL